MTSQSTKSSTYSFVLPVLFYEYLAISLTRSLVPSMLVGAFGVWTYAVVGVVEAIRGTLAFIACPLFGKLSDRVGRKFCLLASVIGAFRFDVPMERVIS
jgi:DHA1 family tetracycline resistance protein-like MFS transporter